MARADGERPRIGRKVRSILLGCGPSGGGYSSSSPSIALPIARPTSM